MPSRRKDMTSSKAIARLIKEGRGAGRGIDYLSWLLVTSFPSHGTSSVMTDWNGQEHHWVSFGERKTAHCYAWCWPDRVTEIRGQFPLRREETVPIAQMMGIKHPSGLITIDIMLTIRDPDGRTYQVARDVKELKELAKRSVLEQLSIALIAMELRGIEWGLIISDKDFPENEYQCVDWAFKARDLKTAVALKPEMACEVARKLNSDVASTKRPVILRDICSDSDSVFGLPRGTSMKIARVLVANKLWRLDMTKLIVPSKPMHIKVDNFEAKMERLWAPQRSA